MSQLPETQQSLILRLRSSAGGEADQAAWQSSVEVYEPFIYRYGRRKGLQDSDANDLVQRVMLSISKSISSWQPASDDSTKPRFRNWLFTIARNHLLNAVKVMPSKSGVGGTTQLRLLAESIDPHAPEQQLEKDYRREAFLWAASRVRSQVQETTWLSFWRTAVEGLSCEEVASQLSISIGSVYAARSRILARLRHEAQNLGAQTPIFRTDCNEVSSTSCLKDAQP